MKKLLTLFIALSIAACQRAPLGPLSPAAGGETGGGSDVGSAGDELPAEHLASWFAGEGRRIHGCLEIAPDFIVPREQAEAEILRAFWGWEDYIRIHRIHRNEKPELRLSTDFVLEKRCGSDTDIAFHLGTDGPAIREAKKQFIHPIAFIQPTSRRRGFVWVANDPVLGQPGRLRAILLHEIGHAYGNDHVPGTIMTAQIAELLASAWTEKDLTRIDHCRELAPCLDCTYSTPVDDAFFPKEWLPKVRALPREPYFAWLHRDASGEFTKLELRAENIERPLGSVTLTRQGKERSAASGAGVFKVVEGDKIVQFVDHSSIQYLLASDFGGILTLEYNLGTCGKSGRGAESPVRATFVSESSPRAVGEFPSVYPW